MPAQALLAAVLAFLAAAFTVVMPWDPPIAPGVDAPATLFQWGILWLVLAVLGIGLGRGLDEPVPRLLPLVPTALLLLMTFSAGPATTIELGRMRLPLPAFARALGIVTLSGTAWYGGVLLSRRALLYLEAQSRR